MNPAGRCRFSHGLRINLWKNNRLEIPAETNDET
jgi:hypothetical protein